MKILFSIEAVMSILADCYSVKNIETGGVLVGFNKKIATDIISSTTHAERKSYTYYQNEKDVEILNKILQLYQENGYYFLGYYHRHPRGMFEMSQGDIAACYEILTSSNYKIDNFLIMVIVTETKNQELPFFAYAVSLDSNKKVVVKKAEIKVLPRTFILEYADYFQPVIIGELNHENKNNRQDNKSIKQTSESLRNQGKRISDNKLAGCKTWA